VKFLRRGTPWLQLGDRQSRLGKHPRAAKKRSKASVITDVTLRCVMPHTEFQKSTGFPLSVGSSGREVVPGSLLNGRPDSFSGYYIHGATTALEAMIPMGAFDPLEPALILSDIKDPKTWRGGAIEFLDPNKMVLVMTPFHRGTIFTTQARQRQRVHIAQGSPQSQMEGQDVVDDPRRRTWRCDFYLLLPSPRALVRTSFAC